MRAFLLTRRRRRNRSTGSLFVAIVAMFAAGLLLPTSTARASGAAFHGSLSATALSRPIVAIASTPSGGGYWLVNSAGRVFAFGDAAHRGDMYGRYIHAPVVDVVPTPSGGGYWLVGRDGAIYDFGNARWHGSMRQRGISAPIVAGASTKSGNGYWLFGRNGAVYNLGDARWHGSMRQRGISAPIVDGTATKSGNGYWMVGRNGAVYNLGDARWYGSMRDENTNGMVVDIARTPSGDGYWLVSTAGSIYHFGDAKWRGSMGGQLMLSNVVSIAAPPSGGYWFVSEEGGVYSASAEGNFSADPNALSTRLQKIMADLYLRINQERGARGLAPLQWDPQLARLASQWSTWMGATGNFQHQDLAALFGDPAFGSRYRSLRENIYRGTGSWRTSGAAHLSLMTSDPHRKTILTPELTSVGIGVSCANGSLWVTEEFGVWLSLPPPAPRDTPPRDPIVAGTMGGAGC
jgi:hypothetical protein